MSRREDRISEPKRHRSRFDREPSPKRSRRGGKLETDRLPKESESEKDRLERVHRNSHRLRDPLPHEAPLRHDSKLEFGSRSTESEKVDGRQGGTKHSSDPTRLPHPRSHFQHDERDNIGKDRRSFNRKADREHGWWRNPEAAVYKTEPIDTRQKDEKVKDNREGDRVWKHDGYFDMEANPKPPVRRRPSFREHKIPVEPDEDIGPEADMGMPNSQKHAVESGKRDERGYPPRRSDKVERPFATGRDFNQAQAWRGNVPSREKFDSSNRYRGRDRFTTGQDNRPVVEKWKFDLYDEANKSVPPKNVPSRERFNSSNRYRGGERFTAGQGNHPVVEKWKHDLYDEANKSPPPKNEEDNISKIEALLAS